MEVILLENIKKLGKIGSKVKVANGFARNYLLKNNKALVASKENLAIFEKRKEITFLLIPLIQAFYKKIADN